MSSQAPNATHRFPHQHLVQGVQKVQLKNLLKIWKAKTLKHGKSFGGPLSYQVKDCRRNSSNRWLVAFVTEALNLWKIYELGSSRMFLCQNESCLSHKTNLAFPTTEKSRAFAINHASVLGFRAIGGGHVTASKVFSFLCLYWWNKNFELTNLWQ